MTRHRRLAAAALLLLAPAALRAQAAGHAGHAGHGAHGQSDSAFAALQKRGHAAMGVDQYASAHRFDPLPDGGRIELQMLADDTAGTRTIRAHLRAVAAEFERGDFSTPAFVHAKPAGDSVPGAAVLARKRAAISYTVRDLPRGGEIRIRTSDPEAVAAVHEFLAFQRSDHRVTRTR